MEVMSQVKIRGLDIGSIPDRVAGEQGGTGLAEHCSRQHLPGASQHGSAIAQCRWRSESDCQIR